MPGTPGGGEPTSAYIILTAGSGAQFYKQVQWTFSASRALVADSLFWIEECEIPPYSNTYTPAVAQAGQSSQGNNVNPTYGSYDGPDQTMVDIYRHGTKPGVLQPGTLNAVYDPYGGAVMYNILYCDGHVSELNDAKEAYRSYRMRFPQ